MSVKHFYKAKTVVTFNIHLSMIKSTKRKQGPYIPLLLMLFLSLFKRAK